MARLLLLLPLVQCRRHAARSKTGRMRLPRHERRVTVPIRMPPEVLCGSQLQREAYRGLSALASHRLANCSARGGPEGGGFPLSLALRPEQVLDLVH